MTDQVGETEEEYYARIRAVPGIFSDKNESAKQVTDKAGTNLQHAEGLEAATSLAPEVHPDGAPEPPEPIDPGEALETALEDSAVQANDQAPVLVPAETPEPTGDTGNATLPVGHIDGTVEEFENEGGAIRSQPVADPEADDSEDDESDDKSAKKSVKKTRKKS